jgi:signal transduction histidine kinase
MRMLRAYKLGIKHARDAMEEDLRETRNFLERELASLRAAVRQLKAEHTRAREIVSALETEHEPGIRLH